MRKGSFIVTAVLVAALLPVFLFAQGGQMKMKDGDKPHCESMQKLDREVSLKIEKLRVDLKLKNLDLEKKQAGIHEQMFKEFTSDNPDRKTIDKLAGEMRDVRAALMSNRHDFMFEVRKLVSADQFKIFMTHQGCGMGQGGCKGGMMDKGAGCGMGGEGGRGCMWERATISARWAVATISARWARAARAAAAPKGWAPANATAKR